MEVFDGKIHVEEYSDSNE